MMRRRNIELKLRLSDQRIFAWFIAGLITLSLLYSGLAYFTLGGDLLGIAPNGGVDTTATSDDIRIRMSLWASIALPWLLLPAMLVVKRQRIRLHDRGVDFTGGMGGLFEFLSRDWSVRWEEIDEIFWQTNSRNYLASRLILVTRQNRHRVAPWAWVEADKKVDRLFARISGDTETTRSQVNESAFIKGLSIHRPDLDVEVKDPGASGKNPKASGDVTPVTGAIAGFFALLVLYFGVEIYFTANEFYAGAAPVAWFVACGLLGSALVFVLLRLIEPDRKDSVVYALLFGLGVGLAANPFLVRLNTWTDLGGLKGHEYQLNQEMIWAAIEGDAPELDLYLASSEWWRQYKPGDTYTFELRKGGLGFWQVSMTPVYNDQKAFYEQTEKQLGSE